MITNDLQAARLRFRAIVESGVSDPIQQFLIGEGLATPMTTLAVIIPPPPRYELPDGWRMPVGCGADYPFLAENYRLKLPTNTKG